MMQKPCSAFADMVLLSKLCVKLTWKHPDLLLNSHVYGQMIKVTQSEVLASAIWVSCTLCLVCAADLLYLLYVLTPMEHFSVYVAYFHHRLRLLPRLHVTPQHLKYVKEEATASLCSYCRKTHRQSVSEHSSSWFQNGRANSYPQSFIVVCLKVRNNTCFKNCTRFWKYPILNPLVLSQCQMKKWT